MKIAAKPVQVEEVPGEGFFALLGQRVLLYGLNYIYEGILAGINDTCVKLDDAYIVYLTGAYNTKTYEKREKLPGTSWYVQNTAIESFGLGK